MVIIKPLIKNGFYVKKAHRHYKLINYAARLTSGAIAGGGIASVIVSGSVLTIISLGASLLIEILLDYKNVNENMNNKQLFFEIEVNSGRIFTEPRSGEVNILPLFAEIEKNNCFSIYTLSDLDNIFRGKPLKIHSETLAKREFTTAILFLFGLRIIHSVGGE